MTRITIGKLDPTVLMQYADADTQLPTDPCKPVRAMATETLRKL